MLLVPVLAWMQYQWLGQLSQAERERMGRTLRTAASQFAVEFDTELSKAIVGLQVEGVTLRDENWIGYSQRYAAWLEAASDPKLVKDVWLVDTVPGTAMPIPPPPPPPPPAPPSGRPQGRMPIFETRMPESIGRAVRPDQLRLRHWDSASSTFEASPWLPEFLPLQVELATQFVGLSLERGGRGNDRLRRDGVSAASAGDDTTLIAPVTLFERVGDRPLPPTMTVLGFTLIRLNAAVLRDSLLAPLTTRHFHGDAGEVDYRVAVVGRDDPSRVVWESETGAAAAIGDSPDVRQDFMAPRSNQMFVFARSAAEAGRRDRTTDLPPQGAPIPRENIVVSVLERRDTHDPSAHVGTGGRAFNPFEGRWTLLAKHRAGSLEAAVGAVRLRNLLLSSGVLLLLTVSVGLIVVSSRRAQALARQQMDFVAAVSHELRTPVSVIGAAAGNLADGVVEDPLRVRKYGETIQTEARRLGETVERVLQLAGIAAGRAAASRTLVEPLDLVNSALQACATEIESAGIEVVLGVERQLPKVFGDAPALRTALRNLISNAVKYGGDAKWIRVTAGREAAPSTLAGRGRQERIVFIVEDRGLGIDADDKPHIFEPFYRGRPAVANQIHGSGLGLNLVQRIAEAHGGAVSVSSEPGKGSAFSLALPIANESTRSSAVTSAAEAVARS
jgi:signal transduction histidine kinase